jgi:hypothetical protein
MKAIEKQISLFGRRASVGWLMTSLAMVLAVAYTLVSGDDLGVAMAAAVGAGGAVGGGKTQVPGEPIATNIPNDPDDPSSLLTDYVSKVLTEHHRTKYPIRHIFNNLRKRQANSWVYRFWSLDERPLSCNVLTGYDSTLQGNVGKTVVELHVDNPKSFVKDNVLMVPSLTGYDDSSPATTRGTLKLEVLGVSVGENKLRVQTINGAKSGVIFPVPSIPAGTLLVRVGTALGERAGRTDPYGDLPYDEFNLIQRFGTTVAMTPFFKEHAKEIDFGLEMQLQRRLRELAEEEEASILFGSRVKRVSIDSGEEKHYMGGFEFFCKNKFFYNSALKKFSREEYSDVMAQLFSANAGSSHRILFCGTGLVSRFNNSTDVIRNTTDLKPTVIEGIDVMGLRGLGCDVDIMRHPLFDAYGLGNAGLFVDSDNASLVSWGGLKRQKLNPQVTGESNEEKYFIHEAISLEVTYPETHMWILPSA